MPSGSRKLGGLKLFLQIFHERFFYDKIQFIGEPYHGQIKETCISGTNDKRKRTIYPALARWYI